MDATYTFKEDGELEDSEKIIIKESVIPEAVKIEEFRLKDKEDELELAEQEFEIIQNKVELLKEEIEDIKEALDIE